MTQQRRQRVPAGHAASIDITHSPDLARAAEEVRQSGVPQVLRRGNEDVALIVPLPARKRQVGGVAATAEADRAAFLASLGSWADVDTERLKQEIRESRSDRRPPIARRSTLSPSKVSGRLLRTAGESW